jgi:hypothetical protein
MCEGSRYFFLLLFFLPHWHSDLKVSMFQSDSRKTVLSAKETCFRIGFVS